MKKNDGLSIIPLILIILILAIVIGVAYHFILGKDGVLDQYKETDTEYNSAEIVEKLNLMVKEKYVLDYKYAQENNVNFDEIHTVDIVMQYLIDNDIIEQLKDINDNIVEDQYYINPYSLNSDIATSQINQNGSNSNGTKIYKIKKIDDKYMIYFVDKYGNEEELGELNFNPEI
jgi:hypothetical protein